MLGNTLCPHTLEVQGSTAKSSHGACRLDRIALSSERTIALTDIIEQSYRHLGQEKIVLEFREAVGL